MSNIEDIKDRLYDAILKVVDVPIVANDVTNKIDELIRAHIWQALKHYEARNG